MSDEVFLEEPMEWSGAEERELLEDVYSKSEILKIHDKKTLKACAYPFDTLAVNADGAVVCCCVDWSRGTYVGNVKDESLYSIWHGNMLNDIRLKHLAGKRSELSSCRNCLRMPIDDNDNLDNVTVEEYLKKLRG